MRDIPRLMNVLNLEIQNVLDSHHYTNYTNAYNATAANGLIKSASTSTCCAHENDLFSETCHRYLKLGDADYGHSKSNIHEEYLKQPLLVNGHFGGGEGAKKMLQRKLSQHHLKHFSECNLNNIGLPSNPRQEFITGGNLGHKSQLDNILIDKSNSKAIILNLAAVNDFKKEVRVGGMFIPITSQVTKTTASNGCKYSDNKEQNEAAEGTANNDCVYSDRKKESVALKEGPQSQLRRHKNGVCGIDQPYVVTEEPNVSTNNKITLDTIHEQGNGNGEKYRPYLQDMSYSTKNPEVMDASPKQNNGNIDKDQQLLPQLRQEDGKRYRRCSSFKMPKQDDSTPAQKKIVRFADVLGLDLADVRTFLDETPSIPASAYSDLKNNEPIERLNILPQQTFTTTTKTLVPMFKQPHTSINFFHTIRDNYVCLESAKVCPLPICSISCTVRVRNLDYHKNVYVRYSTDNWRTFNELRSIYVPDSCDGFSDKFTSVIYIYDVRVSQRIELAIRFHCNGSIYWDNNNGSNYVFQCLPSASVMPSYSQVCKQHGNDRLSTN